jgi:hypothetical protein
MTDFFGELFEPCGFGGALEESPEVEAQCSDRATEQYDEVVEP